MVLNYLLTAHHGKLIHIVPTFQCGPEIKYLFQGGVSGKEGLLAKTSGTLGTSLAWRILFWDYRTTGHISLYGQFGM